MKDPLNLSGDELEAIASKKVQELLELFDAVQILCSHVVPDGTGNTGNVFIGGGNWFARKGMAASFLECDNARTIAHEMPKPEAEPPDGEEWREG